MSANRGGADGGLAAENEGFAASGAEEAEEDAHGGGFAGAVWAEEAGNGAGADFEGGVGERFYGAESFCELLGSDRAHINISITQVVDG